MLFKGQEMFYRLLILFCFVHAPAHSSEDPRGCCESRWSVFADYSLPKQSFYLEESGLSLFDEELLAQTDSNTFEVAALEVVKEANGESVFRTSFVIGKKYSVKGTSLFEAFLEAVDALRTLGAQETPHYVLRFIHNHPPSMMSRNDYFSGEDELTFNLVKAMLDYLGVQITLDCVLIYEDADGDFKTKILRIPKEVSWLNGDLNVTPDRFQDYILSEEIQARL